ncbi:MAG: DUF3450 family protein [Verrucomicrobia bacterium]|nr:DUF3450 family protein [Verrucomicrobiota bacterium]MBT4902591.1 DUF3450 family protein [Verrucomicrobiota bacterium]
MLAFWLTSGSVFAQGSKFEEARTHIEKWVQTRQLIARRDADWRVERENIGQSVGLLQREIDLLKEAIDKSEQVDSEADAEKKRITLSLEDLKKANKVVDAALWGMERQALALMTSFPDPLKDRTSNVRSRIPLKKEDLRGRSAAERMQNVVAMLNEADRFNSAITLAIEVRKDAEGKDRQVQALYLGLGHAYYADQSGSFAGVGVPGAEGWTWTVNAELGSTIRKVIDIYENERKAEFIAIPVNIQ